MLPEYFDVYGPNYVENSYTYTITEVDPLKKPGQEVLPEDEWPAPEWDKASWYIMPVRMSAALTNLPRVQTDKELCAMSVPF